MRQSFMALPLFEGELRAGQTSMQPVPCTNLLVRRCAGMHFRRAAKSCHARTGDGVLLGRLCAVRWNDFAGMKKRIAAKLYSVESSAKCYGVAAVRRRTPCAGQNPIQSAACAMHKSACAVMYWNALSTIRKELSRPDRRRCSIGEGCVLCGGTILRG